MHCLVEKPLADNVMDAESILSSAEAGGVILAVGHVERHNPVVAYAKDALESGVWGKVVTMSSTRVSRYPERIKDVGVIFDLAIHDLDIMRYLAGSDVRSLFAIGGNTDYPDKEDHVSIIFEFDNGVHGLCESSWLTPMKVRKLNLTCTKAYVVMDYMEQSVKVFRSEFVGIDQHDLSNMEHSVEIESPEIVSGEPLKLELEDFLFAVSESRRSNNRFPLVTGHDGLLAVRMAEIALNSYKENSDLKNQGLL